MSKITLSEITGLLALTQPSISARNAQQFMTGLKQGFEGLHRLLLGGLDSEQNLAVFDSVLRGSHGSTRQKQVLELCSWPIFDKPALPVTPGAVPEFLWLYALPVMVQVSLEGMGTPLRPQAGVGDVGALSSAVYRSERLNPKAVVFQAPGLFTREDLQKEGPSRVAARFVKAELGLGFSEIPASGTQWDPEIESARVVTMYALGAAKLPRGERTLMTNETQWDGADIEREILAGLTAQGYAIESVTSLPPCSMAEAVLKCTGTGYLEMHRLLTLARYHYDVAEVFLEHPAEGWAEVHARLENDPEPILIRPAFSFVEPLDELQACVQQCCESLTIPFAGAFAVAGPTSSMLQ